LADLAKHALSKTVDRNLRTRLELLLTEKDYPRLAMELKVKAVHIAERDSQQTNVPKKVNGFVNTWCIGSLCEDSYLDSEFTWGTHEKQPPLGSRVGGKGTDGKTLSRDIQLASQGMHTLVSRV
jgi:homospermidine synthase